MKTNNTLTFAQRMDLANWLATSHEAGELDYKSIAKVTKEINAEPAIDFVVTDKNVSGMAGQLNLTWPRHRKRTRPTTIQLAPEELLCIVAGICEIARRLPSMQLDPDSCLERIHDRLLDEITTETTEQLSK